MVKKYSANNKKFVNPYKMNPYDVKPWHFRDARLYDKQIKESGWEIQRSHANKKYRQWVCKIRKFPEMRNFHRLMTEIVVNEPYYYYDNNSELVEDTRPVIKVISMTNYLKGEEESVKRGYAVPTGTVVFKKETNNIHVVPKEITDVAQSVEKGVKIDDPNYIPKMFTETMGRYISQTRNSLGLTQAQVAKKINVDSNTIKNIEKGGLVSFNAGSDLVKNLSRVLNLPTINYQD